MSFGETESSMSLPSKEDQHLLPKSVFDRPGSDRWNLASTTFPDAGPMVRIRFPPAESHERTPAAETAGLGLASGARAVDPSPDAPGIKEPPVQIIVRQQKCPGHG